jgi:hypothetical protein
MHKLNSFILIGLMVLAAGCATNRPNPLQRLSGTYVGQVNSVINIPVRTEFIVDDKGV